MIYATCNAHLGDAVWAAIMLRHIGGQHTFYMPRPYMRCISECLEGTEVEVKDMADAPPDARSTWIACGRYEGSGVRYNHQTDLVEFLMQFGNAMARENGIAQTMFRLRQDMLCPFPAIQRDVEAPEFDILFVNAKPLSGQCPELKDAEMDALIWKLASKHKVLCTNPTDVDVPQIQTSICGIGNLANRAKLVVAVATGAAACVHNVFAETRTMLLLHPIVLNYGRTNLSHHRNCSDVEQQLVKEGWL